jgi:hypothetical protein
MLFNRRITLAARIGGAVFVLTLGLTGAGGFFYYYSVYEFIITQMGGRLMDVGRTGAYLFDEQDRSSIRELKRIIDNRSVPLSPADLQLTEDDSPATLSRETADDVVRGPDFQRIVQRLRQIKDGSRRAVSPLRRIPQAPENAADPPLVRFAYLLAPLKESPDYRITRFIADADYEDIDLNQDGVIAEDEQGNPPGAIWLTPLEEFKVAFKGEAVAAREWYTDNWGTWQSAAIPIKDEN